MIRAIAILLIVFSIPSLAGDGWPGVAFTEARAYAWPNGGEARAVILEDLTLKSGVIDPGGALLTAKQIRLLTESVTGKHPEYPRAACYTPRNAIVFYDAEKSPVAFIEICFSCYNHRTFPEETATNFDLVTIAAIFDAHKLPMGELANSASFKENFEELQKIFKEDEPEE